MLTGSVATVIVPFFFQAEDGIRDDLVTGVQTCALPIFGFTPRAGTQVLVRGRISVYEARGEYQLIVEHLEEAGIGALKREFRSEERRVGKECRTRRAREH